MNMLTNKKTLNTDVKIDFKDEFGTNNPGTLFTY